MLCLVLQGALMDLHQQRTEEWIAYTHTSGNSVVPTWASRYFGKDLLDDVTDMLAVSRQASNTSLASRRLLQTRAMLSHCNAAGGIQRHDLAYGTEKCEADVGVKSIFVSTTQLAPDMYFARLASNMIIFC